MQDTICFTLVDESSTATAETVPANLSISLTSLTGNGEAFSLKHAGDREKTRPINQTLRIPQGLIDRH
jgi:hypothetical protein